ncbi:MAG TPA: GNAT family N-acetyltransferase [Chitinophagaceae bacterium]|nr:GNAT family N-acetyltransferase [Chitinophagaceae bacterium]
MNLSLTIANLNEAALISDLRNNAAQHLTEQYGKGQWSYHTNEKTVINSMTGKSKVLVTKNNDEIVGTLCLQTKKPWAIDASYFTKVVQPLYLVDMAIQPSWQRKGIGSYMLHEVKPFVISWPAEAIRLDAYDAESGAGGFYRKSGYTERGRVIYKGDPLIYFEMLI